MTEMDYFKDPIYITRPLLPDLEKVTEKMKQIWDSKWLTNNGPLHDLLESRLRSYLKVEDIVLFVNGTLALTLGIKAMKLTGEVITTPFTFPATLLSLDWNGLSPVFCDIENDTFNMDANKIECLITDKTSAILAVHVFGNPCCVNTIKNIAEKYHLKVIYDGAHSFGSEINGIPAGRYGDITMFSFHATKLFNTVEGGALAISDRSLAEKLRALKNFGFDIREDVVSSGTNAKLNEIQAAVGLEVLNIVDIERHKRRFLHSIYVRELSEIKGIRIVTSSDDDGQSFQYFTIEIDKDKYGISRDELYLEMKNRNVHARRYFYPLCSSFSWYREIESARPENLPVANMAVNNVLCLPYYGDLGEETAVRICRIIKQIGVQGRRHL